MANLAAHSAAVFFTICENPEGAVPPNIIIISTCFSFLHDQLNPSMPKRALIPLKFEVIFNYDNFSRWHKVTRMAQS